MGQILHGGATTTEAVRRAIQNSQESLRALAKRYGINQKTVVKWKNRTNPCQGQCGLVGLNPRSGKSGPNLPGHSKTVKGSLDCRLVDWL